MKKFLAIFLISIMTLASPVSISSAASGPIIFLIDTSGSMKIEKMDAVRNAVKGIIANLQGTQEIAIISFSEKVSTIQPITTDHALAIQQVDLLFAGGDTSMYDAIATGLQLNDSKRPSQYILLSDGEDTTSLTSLDSLLPTISSNGIPINTIGIQVTQAQTDVLSRISSASGGTFYNVTDISNLLATYQIILEPELAPTPQVETPKPESLGPLNLDLFGSKEFEYGVSIFVGLLIFFTLLIYRKNSRKRNRQKARLYTLQKYTYGNFRKVTNKFRESIVSYAFIPKRIEKIIKDKLELIHADISYASTIKLLLGGWLFSSLLLSLVSRSLFIGVLVSSIMAPLLFKTITDNIRRKQVQKFGEELPELLNILASALRSGLSLTQGLEAFSSDSKGEVAREMRRTIGEIRVGTPIDEALMGVADRMESEDLRWAVTALSIQRVVGGSMATILTTTFETVKARAEIRREVKTLAAEGKLSAYVLMALPLGIFTFLLLTRREYVSAFWSNPTGIFLMIVIGILLTVGWTWMKKIVEIKI